MSESNDTIFPSEMHLLWDVSLTDVLYKGEQIECTLNYWYRAYLGDVNYEFFQEMKETTPQSIYHYIFQQEILTNV